jgi:hypothetical protein
MKFPITREELQAFNYSKEQEELKEEEIQKRFTQILDKLCKDFKQTMNSNSHEKKFIWREINHIIQLQIHGYNTQHKTDYLPQFIDKIKKVFIGCDIIVDPLQTYLIIDWS